MMSSAPGDDLEVKLQKGRVVLTPKTLVDKDVERRLAEGLEDIRRGRVYGPFRSANAMIRSLRQRSKRRSKTRKTA